MYQPSQNQNIVTLQGSQYSQQADEVSIESMIAQAGLDFTYKEQQVFYTCPETGVPVPNLDRKQLVHSKTLKALEIVKKSFKVVQPSDVVNFYQKICETGNYSLESCGFMNDGLRIWALAKVNDIQANQFSANDQLQLYVFFVTANDGTLATTIKIITKRIVCNNMLAMVIRGKADAVNYMQFKVRHTSTPDYEKIVKKFDTLPQYWESFCGDIEKLTQTKISVNEAIEFITKLHADKHGEVPQSFARLTIPKIVNVYQNAIGQDTLAANGTLWGAVNAITYYYDHEVKAQSDAFRFRNAMTGKGETLKTQAFTQALALAA